ncbi:MAG: long-chain-fatty-acid--CoA ligase [Desulfocucumaceae bacterium]
MEQRPWQRHYDYDVPTSIRYPRVPVQELLQVPFKACPDKAALDFYGTEMTFWELRTQILRMANALGSLGIQKGDRVGLHLPNCPQYIIAYHAVMLLGAVVVNINPMYTPDELKLVAGTVGISTLVTFDMVIPLVKSLCKDVQIPRVVVTRVTDYVSGITRSTAGDLDLEEGWLHFSEVLEGSQGCSWPRIEVFPEDIAMINFTGGTTGVPKGAVLTHANLVAAILQCYLWGRTTMTQYPMERRYVLSVLPFFHVYGNIVAMNLALYNCSTQILVPRFNIDELMGLLSNFKEISFFPTVPTIISAIVNHPRAGELELDKKLGLLNSGAAPMPVELIEQAKAMGIIYSEGWGMTESTSLGISNPVMGLKKAGSVGIPFPDTDVRLVDPVEGREEVPPGEPGELIIKSPLVMKGYWNSPEETAGQIRDGWLYTGDMAVMDEDGYIFIVDRKKDMIIAGGFNIYPREIDEVLYSHPKVADAVSVGIKDLYRGETVKAYIVLKDGEEAAEQEILDFCRSRLAAYKVPKLVEFREELPKSVIGKVLRRILKDEEEAGPFSRFKAN